MRSIHLYLQFESVRDHIVYDILEAVEETDFPLHELRVETWETIPSMLDRNFVRAGLLRRLRRFRIAGEEWFYCPEPNLLFTRRDVDALGSFDASLRLENDEFEYNKAPSTSHTSLLLANDFHALRELRLAGYKLANFESLHRALSRCRDTLRELCLSNVYIKQGASEASQWTEILRKIRLLPSLMYLTLSKLHLVTHANESVAFCQPGEIGDERSPPLLDIEASGRNGAGLRLGAVLERGLVLAYYGVNDERGRYIKQVVAYNPV
jgi:hypothetical protein